VGERRCRVLVLDSEERSRGAEGVCGRTFGAAGRCRVRCWEIRRWRLDEGMARGGGHMAVVAAGIGPEMIFCEGGWCQNGRSRRRLYCGC
jgi:hypothetical protein